MAPTGYREEIGQKEEGRDEKGVQEMRLSRETPVSYKIYYDGIKGTMRLVQRAYELGWWDGREG